MNRLKMKPAKGKVFIKDLIPGKQFNMNGKTGILLGYDVNADVIVTKLPKTQYYKDNESYYRGRQIWSGYTEVEAI